MSQHNKPRGEFEKVWKGESKEERKIVRLSHIVLACQLHANRLASTTIVVLGQFSSTEDDAKTFKQIIVKMSLIYPSLPTTDDAKSIE